jgi:hypothetical protein
MSITVVMLSLTSCVSVKAIYTPPIVDNSPLEYSKIINKPFDEVWDALINYSASTFFGIENFEKDSGLLTLSFGASNPQNYVTGGHWKADVVYGMNELHFDGDYVEYLSLHQNGKLTGKMNIVIKKITDSSTQVIVNARYVFSSVVIDAKGRTQSNTWSFNTGSCQEVAVTNVTKGTQPTRTICPTYKAENAILNALE